MESIIMKLTAFILENLKYIYSMLCTQTLVIKVFHVAETLAFSILQQHLLLHHRPVCEMKCLL